MEELSQEELKALQVRVRRDHPGGEQELVIFRRQYLQKLDLKHITFPSRELLQLYDIQRWIHSFICSPPADEYHPKSDHDILNELVKRIEEAVSDAEEPDIYDPLVEFAAELCIRQRRPLTEVAQCDVWVSYECPGPADMLDNSRRIKLLEKPQLLAAIGCTGYRTWQAALALANKIATEWLPEGRLKGKRVLELGAGTGLLSLLCAKEGDAQLVVGTDGALDAIERLKLADYVNGLCGLKKSTYGVYWWGETFEGTIIGEALEDGRPFDFVIASDVVSSISDLVVLLFLISQQTYDPPSLPSLVKTFSMLLAINPATTLVVSATYRNQHTFDDFVRICGESFFDLTFRSCIDIFVSDEYSLATEVVELDLKPVKEQHSLFNVNTEKIMTVTVTVPKP